MEDKENVYEMISKKLNLNEEDVKKVVMMLCYNGTVGDLDDWWYADFLYAVSNHNKECSAVSAIWGGKK